MKVEVTTTEIKIPGNTILGTQEKSLYYLLIGEGDNRVQINIGHVNYVNITTLINEKKK